MSYAHDMLTHSVHCHWIKSITESALVLLEVRNLVHKFIMDAVYRETFKWGKPTFFSLFYSDIVCVQFDSCTCAVGSPSFPIFLGLLAEDSPHSSLPLRTSCSEKYSSCKIVWFKWEEEQVLEGICPYVVPYYWNFTSLCPHLHDLVY